MVFSGFSFLFLFFPAVLILYFALPGIRAKNIVLCLTSLLFYSWGEPVYLFLMLASILINYTAGLGIERFPAKKKLILVADLVINLGTLAYCKYTDFFIDNVNQLAGTALPHAGIALPLGISFYTFQMISYIIDCQWETVKSQKSFIKFFMYVSLFPQLVAGPIVRYSTIEKEIDSINETNAAKIKDLNAQKEELAKKLQEATDEKNKKINEYQHNEDELKESSY